MEVNKDSLSMRPEVKYDSDETYKVDMSKAKDKALDEEQEKTIETTEQEDEQDEDVLQKKEVEVVEKKEVTQDKDDDGPIEIVNEEEELAVKDAKKKETEAADVKTEDKKEIVEKDTKVDIPENIQSLVDFMNDTGGTIEDYVRLNADYDSVDELTLLKEYYKSTKKNLSNEDIEFLIEDRFSYDEEEDAEVEVKRKKLAYKEELAKARTHLKGVKDSYYKEIKSGKNLTEEQKAAVDFFNQYKKQTEEMDSLADKQSEVFTKKTNELFNEDFKGFDFKVGDSKYRYKVKDVDAVKQSQMDLIDSFKTFLSEENTLGDAHGYHKALFAAKNADKIAAHFYDQGKADAIKEIAMKDKNVNVGNNRPRILTADGYSVKAVPDNSANKLTFKAKK